MAVITRRRMAAVGDADDGDRRSVEAEEEEEVVAASSKQQHQHQHPRRQRSFRPPGAPAGTWPHEHWSVCELHRASDAVVLGRGRKRLWIKSPVLGANPPSLSPPLLKQNLNNNKGVFHDPYERVNFWSHGLPGVLLACLSVAAATGAIRGAAPLSFFCAAAAVTHLLSALTHAWPDSVFLDKLDHFGITCLILATPASQLMVLHPRGDTTCMAACAAALLASAALPRVPRTLGFVGSAAVMVVHYYYLIMNWPMCVQVALYALGALSFLRAGGHDRPYSFLTDHHFLHYFVSAACAIQAWNLRRLAGPAGGAAAAVGVGAGSSW